MVRLPSVTSTFIAANGDRRYPTAIARGNERARDGDGPGDHPGHDRLLRFDGSAPEVGELADAFLVEPRGPRAAELGGDGLDVAPPLPGALDRRARATRGPQRGGVRGHGGR